MGFFYAFAIYAASEKMIFLINRFKLPRINANLKIFVEIDRLPCYDEN